MTPDELRWAFRRAYPEATDVELQEILEEAAGEPNAEWIRIALGRVIAPGSLGVSLEVLQYNKEVPQPEYDSASINRAQQDKIRNIIDDLASLILRHTHPLMALDAMSYACGKGKMRGDTIPSLAKKYGVSKQAFSRCVKDIAGALDLPLELSGRSEKASRHMSLSHKRNESIIKKAR